MRNRFPREIYVYDKLKNCNIMKKIKYQKIGCKEIQTLFVLFPGLSIDGDQCKKEIYRDDEKSLLQVQFNRQEYLVISHTDDHEDIWFKLIIEEEK